PASVVVFPIRLTIASRLTSGRPRQFCVMWQNSRCSILFHLLVPGGKWHTLNANPSSSASPCSATFHSRVRTPLLPPPSAVIRIPRARGNRAAPIPCHQRRIVAAAKYAVSWVIPTLTHPWLFVTS